MVCRRRRIYALPRLVVGLILLAAGCGLASAESVPSNSSERNSSHLLPVQYDDPLPVGDIRNLQNCAEYPFDAPDRGAWNALSSKQMAEEATPGHRSTDRVASVGDAIHLGAAMAYDDTPLASEWVRLFVGDCQGWSQIGVRKTDDAGEVAFRLDNRLPEGIYGVVFQAVGDGTTVRTQLWVLPRQTTVVAFDLAGAAFEVSGEAVPTEAPGPVRGAPTLTLWHTQQGRLVVYLNRSSGSESDTDAVSRWRQHLRHKGFAVGPVVDLDLALEPNTHPDDQRERRPGWGQAQKNFGPGPAIATSLTTLYIEDEMAARSIEALGVDASETVFRRQYCTVRAHDGRRTGWTGLIRELVSSDDEPG